MPNSYFQFKQFTVHHDQCAMKVTTDACLFGSWCAKEVSMSMVNSQWSIEKQFNALDIGTGSGLLSLMMAQQNAVTIDAVEIDAAAAKQAGENVKASSFAHAITVFHADILAWGTNQYDIIFSNPPFYESELISSTSNKNVAHHSEGLRLEELFIFIKDQLKDTGSFYLLLPYKRKATIEKLLHKAGLFLHKEVTVHPSASHLPFRLLLKGSKHASLVHRETLSIYTSEKHYTPEFTELLKDYYLYL